MKFTKILLFILSCAVCGCMRNGELTHQDKIICRYDGTGSVDWSRTDSIVFAQKDESDNETIVKTSWDMDSLYILLKVHDSDLRAEQLENDHPRLFLDDMVEVLIDTDNDKTPYWHEDDIIYHINILGYKKDDRGTPDYLSDATWNGEARYIIEITGTVNDSSDKDEGYIVIISFPWSEIGHTPRSGLKLGVNFANGDNDGNGRQLYNWCDSSPMRSPDSFGTLFLTD